MDIAATFNGKRGQRKPADPALSNFTKTASKETQTMDTTVKKCRLNRAPGAVHSADRLHHMDLVEAVTREYKAK
jgi:hypothetical protein